MSIKPVEGTEEKKERQNSGRVGGGGGGGGKSPAAEKMAQLKSLSPGKNTQDDRNHVPNRFLSWLIP